MNVRRKWTATEIRTLASRYPVEGPAALVQEFGRSKNSITNQARRLWIKSDSRWQRQAINRATNNATVNPRFFDQPSPEAAFVCGFVHGCGTIKSKHRWVLKLRVEVHRTAVLSRVLELMECKHQIQKSDHWNVVEICNSRLVQSLIHNWGKPAGRSNPDPPLPDLPLEFMPYFAKGYLDAAGRESFEIVRWTGTPRIIDQLTDFVQTAVNIGPTKSSRIYGKVNVVWTGKECVQRILDWLKN